MINDLNELIRRIDALKAEIDSLRPINSEQEQRLMQKIRLDWNFHSNSIEGNSLDYGETKALLLWGITAQGKPLRDHLEIRGHNEALEYIIDIVKNQDIDITETFIRQLHAIIIPENYYADSVSADGHTAKRLIRSGAYKSAANHVVTQTGEKLFFANPEDTPIEMHDLIDWYNATKDDASVHPLILATLFHYKFVRIHPFDDGNGRMSRLLMNFILMKKGLVSLIIPKEIKDDYYQALQYADANDLDKFAIFIGNRLIVSLELWLKAAKGEPIDENDSIEAMVRLINDKIHRNKGNQEVQEPALTYRANSPNMSTAKALIINIFNELDKFAALFETTRLAFDFERFVCEIKPESFAHTSEFIGSVCSFIEFNKSQQFKLVIEFDKFKAPDTSDLNIKIEIPFDYANNALTITLPSGQIKVDNHISEAQTKDITMEFAKYIKTEIEKCIDKTAN